MLSEKGSDDTVCKRKVVKGREVTSAVKYLVSAMGLSLDSSRVLGVGMFSPVLLYNSKNKMHLHVQIDNQKLDGKRTD